MEPQARISGPVLALSGGVGGAKLAVGLDRVLETGQLTVVANTGDDFQHLGLMICPDLDTLLYTLSGLNDPARGWGRLDETWTFMNALSSIGGETWFTLGDGDLAIHVERTRRLANGEALSEITGHFRKCLGVSSRLLPMSDDPVRTKLLTREGWLDFQDYFVRLRCTPELKEITFDGVDIARPHPEIVTALNDHGLRAVVVCPSNPLISIEPILAVPGIRPALAACRAPVIAVSPIVGGRAVKGPTAKMLNELGHPASAAAVGRRYEDILDGYVMDTADADEAASLAIPVRLTNTLMHTMADREMLARTVLEFAAELVATVGSSDGAVS